MRVLLAHGANVNDASDTGTTPLSAAAGALAEPAVKLLLDHGASVCARDNAGQSPLLSAVRAFNTRVHASTTASRVVTLILEAGTPVDTKDNVRRLPPLLICCFFCPHHPSQRLLAYADASVSPFDDPALSTTGESECAVLGHRQRSRRQQASMDTFPSQFAFDVGGGCRRHCRAPGGTPNIFPFKGNFIHLFAVW